MSQPAHDFHRGGELDRRDVGRAPGGKGSGFWRSRTGLIAIAFLAIGAFFLLSEHRAHTLGILPYLLLLACPLLHMFMHRGHGGHGGHRESEPPTRSDTTGRGA